MDIPSKTFTRGKKTIDKHLGFAFVQFESKAEADKAIEAFNGKEFKGRNIYVKKAVPPPTEEEKQQKIEAFRAMKAEQRAKKDEEKAKKEEEKAQKADDGNTKEQNGTAKPKKAAKKKAPKKAIAGDSSEAAATATPASDEPQDKVPDGKPSADTIFITNLDYKVDVKTLNNLLKDLKPKWIHVPTRRVPFHILKRQKSKGRTVFNKGIAFVKFSSEDLQKQAIADFNGKELNGREIIVDIAIDARIPKSDDEDTAEVADVEDVADVAEVPEVAQAAEVPEEK